MIDLVNCGLSSGSLTTYIGLISHIQYFHTLPTTFRLLCNLLLNNLLYDRQFNVSILPYVPASMLEYETLHSIDSPLPEAEELRS